MGDVVAAVSVFQEACAMLWVVNTTCIINGECVIHVEYATSQLITIMVFIFISPH